MGGSFCHSEPRAPLSTEGNVPLVLSPKSHREPSNIPKRFFPSADNKIDASRVKMSVPGGPACLFSPRTGNEIAEGTRRWQRLVPPRPPRREGVIKTIISPAPYRLLFTWGLVARSTGWPTSDAPLGPPRSIECMWKRRSVPSLFVINSLCGNRRVPPRDVDVNVGGNAWRRRIPMAHLSA